MSHSDHYERGWAMLRAVEALCAVGDMDQSARVAALADDIEATMREESGLSWRAYCARIGGSSDAFKRYADTLMSCRAR